MLLERDVPPVSQQQAPEVPPHRVGFLQAVAVRASTSLSLRESKGSREIETLESTEKRKMMYEMMRIGFHSKDTFDTFVEKTSKEIA